jgi:hypothetical protein
MKNILIKTMKSIASKSSLAAITLFTAAVAYRLAVGFSGTHALGLNNFSPLAAMALCGAIYLPRRAAVALPLAALFVSDLVLNAHYGAPLLHVELLSRYVVLAGVAGLGWMLRAKPGFVKVQLASVAGSMAFYLVTNTGSWMVDAAYAKTFAGWVQALTVGEPGLAPTWTFFRNTLASDTLFTAVFLGCMAVFGAHVSAPASAKQAA